jgi:DNA-binding transcriptional MerR regulator/catechol 2,3-dioxygenase-like lactoylglutathione lyase family enzyme
MILMNDERLMSIGNFSLRSGLSIAALRYYDEIDLLTPAFVDPLTGYRRYRPSQLDTARLVSVLRALDLPVLEVREAITSDGTDLELVLERHRSRLTNHTRALNRMTTAVDKYLQKGLPTPQQTTCQPVQITIHADNVPATVTFYADVFDAEFNESTSSFLFGTWKTDSFFLLTIEPQCPDGDHPGRNACFGFLVDDLDSVHQRALDAGATEVHPPRDFDWKPRTSIVDDPNGNRIALSQA